MTCPETVELILSELHNCYKELETFQAALVPENKFYKKLYHQARIKMLEDEILILQARLESLQEHPFKVI